ncbi:MAG: hypothetical protein GF353_16755 [Candidatus Lokiarchaeota archaeon]|nr:hypothetical protein [Candidatus Lokiarchaeota archaeon]
MLVTHQSQEAVEFAPKSALKLIGIDFPQWHNIGEFLINAKSKYPNDFKANILNLSKIF